MHILTRKILLNLMKLQPLVVSGLLRTHIGCSTNKCVETQQELPVNVENPNKDAKCVLDKQFTVTVIPGDGVGPELIESVEEASHAPVQFEYFSLPKNMPLMNMTYEQVRDSIAKNGVCLKGSFTKIPQEYQKRIQRRLFLDLDLYASVIHTTSLPGLKAEYGDVDMVVIRECSVNEDDLTPTDKSISEVYDYMKDATIKKSDRIAEFVFEYAKKNKRKKVTVIHKSSIMKISDGLFLRSFEKMSALYRGIEYENMIIETAIKKILSKPSQFDVLVTPNLYGNIVNKVATDVVGGSAFVPKVICSRKQLLFESACAKDNENSGNPIGMLLSASKLLEHLNLADKGRRIREAILKVIAEGKIKPKDLGGNASIKDFTRSVTFFMDLMDCE